MEREIRWLLEEKYRFRRGAQAEKDIARILGGEPIAYVIGFVDFLGCRISLSQRPLIPRTETEWWAENAIKDIAGTAKRTVRCLDVFAGSGCIGISVAARIGNARVDFADREKHCLRQIKINIARNKIGKGRCRVIRSDIFSHIEDRYDYIFANPPYVAATRKENVQKSVRDFEPRHALFAGKDGLFYIKRFLKDAPRHLGKDGVLYMEFDSPQKLAVARLMRAGGYRTVKFFKDQFGKWRYVKAAV